LPPSTVRDYPIDRVIILLHFPVYKMADMLYQQLNSQSNADSGEFPARPYFDTRGYRQPDRLGWQ